MKSTTVKRGVQSGNLIASIPHGSSILTDEMQLQMNRDVILTNNDWHLNELYSFLPDLDITTCSANFSRYVIDVNRNIENAVHGSDYTKSLIYLQTTFQKDIYDAPLSREEIESRVNQIYLPYHSLLEQEINAILERTNQVYLFDLHSFFAQSQADVVLGTKDGITCSRVLLDLVYDAFVSEGFRVTVDVQGLRGGYIVSRYSKIEGVETIQIELRYTKYLQDRYFGEEDAINREEKLFEDTKQRLKRVFERIKQELGTKSIDW